MRPAILLLLSATAFAQTFSSHSGWSFTDTLQTATDVVVGDIVSGSAVDDGSQVSVKATVRVVRVLSGSAAAGAELVIQWQYRPTPLQGPAVTSTVPKVRGLWFVRRAEGKAQALQAAVMMWSLGGFYLPAGDAPRYYNERAPLAYKIACEVAPVIEDLVARHGDDLGPQAPQAPVAGAPPAWAQTVTQFNALTMALQGTGKSAAEAYAYFTSMPDPKLKLVGIQGRLQTGDASALLDLEKDLTVIAPALNRGSMMPMTSMGVDVRTNLLAAHALGRLATGETALPGIEAGAASQLASTRSPEFLPYLMVMLEQSERQYARCGVDRVLPTAERPDVLDGGNGGLLPESRTAERCRGGGEGHTLLEGVVAGSPGGNREDGRAAHGSGAGEVQRGGERWLASG